jgi:carbon-monoxide dehydrogenase small subunit
MHDGTQSIALTFQLNGRTETQTVPTNLTLTELLRDRFGLKSVKFSCSRGVCGVCTVLVDGLPTASCAMFAFQVDGSEVVTVEGLRPNDQGLHPIQSAFVENGGFQCGYCTPGMILVAKALLDQHPEPSRETVVEWLSSNVCRCTGYGPIIDSVMDAAERLRKCEEAE